MEQSLASLKIDCDDEYVIYTITMHAGENRFTLEMNNQLHKCLDKVDSDLSSNNHSPTIKAALIMTGSGKTFSLGLHLPDYYTDKNPQNLFHTTFQRLLARLLSMPIITVAAMNGHSIAGGLVVALACDYRVMNGTRGLVAMNEIQLPSSIPTGMIEVIKAKITDHTIQRDILFLGKMFKSQDALDMKIVDLLAADGENVMSASLDLIKKNAHPLQKSHFFKIIKQTLYRDTLYHLGEGKDFMDHFLFAQKYRNDHVNGLKSKL